MKVYKDILTDDEMFTDTYKMKLVDDVIYEVYGKLVSRNQDNIVLAGANPSAEDADADIDTSAVERGIDVVLNHRLQESFAFGDKKSFTSYLKDYMKRLLTKLQESSPDQIDVLKSNMSRTMKDILGRFNELQFFTGESMDIDGMVAMCEYREIDGESVPVFMFFKHGLQEEKL
ncbi:translationally-controlled tumor protein homolog [Drosophila grimshawi]|uniref:Translationally-controlled tumor protein homolog n=1 Tax=Drosophila grimshawi TaxID=7222 RepID=B4J901_DROGR|nr:translationally-controlled tumor protein homolog [Drosophila grimshawi]EDW01350.1 GH20502 [Drosophila grimshawi]